MSTTSANPSTFWTGTTWQAFATGKTIIGIDTSDTEFNSVNKTGGSKEVVLTVPNLPAHNHTVGDNTHSHTENAVGDHSHTLNDHSHYIAPHQHGTSWGEKHHTGYWGNWPGGNFRGLAGSIDNDNNMFLTSPVDQWTNGAGAVGMSGSGAHSHTINAITHSHTLSNTGSNTAHCNLQPYIVTYIWKRIS